MSWSCASTAATTTIPVATTRSASGPRHPTGITAASQAGSGSCPSTWSTAICNGTGARSAIGVASNWTRNRPARWRQDGRASARSRRYRTPSGTDRGGVEAGTGAGSGIVASSSGGSAAARWRWFYPATGRLARSGVATAADSEDARALPTTRTARAAGHRAPDAGSLGAGPGERVVPRRVRPAARGRGAVRPVARLATGRGGRPAAPAARRPRRPRRPHPPRRRRRTRSPPTSRAPRGPCRRCG